MVGDPDFLDSSSVPLGKIPLTGTLFELFDAMRTDPENENIACRVSAHFLPYLT